MLGNFLSKRFGAQNEANSDSRRDSRLSHTYIGRGDTDDVLSSVAQCPTAHSEDEAADNVPDPIPQSNTTGFESRDPSPGRCPSSLRGMVSTRKGRTSRRVRRKVSHVFSKLNVVRMSGERAQAQREAAQEKWRAELFGWDREPWRRESDLIDMENWNWGQDNMDLKEKCIEQVE